MTKMGEQANRERQRQRQRVIVYQLADRCDVLSKIVVGVNPPSSLNKKHVFENTNVPYLSFSRRIAFDVCFSFASCSSFPCCYFCLSIVFPRFPFLSRSLAFLLSLHRVRFFTCCCPTSFHTSFHFAP